MIRRKQTIEGYVYGPPTQMPVRGSRMWHHTFRIVQEFDEQGQPVKQTQVDIGAHITGNLTHRDKVTWDTDHVSAWRSLQRVSVRCLCGNGFTSPRTASRVLARVPIAASTDTVSHSGA